MAEKERFRSPKVQLGDEDKGHIMEIFFESIVPKLIRLHARSGNLNCEFAGEAYVNWNILFRSRGSGFQIAEFFYDEDGVDLDLDL